ncbi:SMP-30/gluconolactonase/LRE family protein [Agrococcus baldri]|uniref:Uncharacterized protein n=1 Tax=Agrococcus baldri TaxID=153730 RepID=A0AA87REK8_9MICO|nr:hypothetical protein [Agrococcus baldri]GEK79151.1 hypothetical protein ABA31_05020 [Agrococcus baldri]
MSSSNVAEFIGVIDGPINAEKIVGVPGTPWVIGSGMMATSVPTGRLYAIDSQSHGVQEIYPYRCGSDLDESVFGSEPAVLDPLEFEPHGLSVLRAEDGSYRLYVVNHGGRESIEVFDVELGGRFPVLTWRGAVVLPRGTWPNDVAPLADGGFIVSNTADPDTDGLAEGMARMFAGVEIPGAIEWRPGVGSSTVDGSLMAGANGIVATADGQTVFIAGWRNRNVVRLRRSAEGTEVDVVELDILVDNLTWTPDGDVLATGAFDTTPDQIFACFSTKDRCFFPCQVVRIDAETLEATTLVQYGEETFGLGTTGLIVGDEVWVSSARAAGIARFAG